MPALLSQLQASVSSVTLSVSSGLLQRLPVSYCLVQLPGASSQWHRRLPPRSRISLGANKANNMCRSKQTGMAPAHPCLLLRWRGLITRVESSGPTWVGSVQELPVFTPVRLRKQLGLDVSILTQAARPSVSVDAASATSGTHDSQSATPVLTSGLSD